MAVVALSRALSYEPPEISLSLERTLNYLAGLDARLKGNVRVLVKVNLLSPFSPVERAIYTHPRFVREVVKFLRNWNTTIVVGDDVSSRQGDPFTSCGLRDALADLDVELVHMKEKGFKEVRVNGQMLDKIHLAWEALEADVIINLPKLKTHSFTTYTGAIKNMFGLIPHGLRLKIHRQHIWPEDFSNALVDIFAVRKPDVNIMDAIIAMEGEGPSSGDPKTVSLILASHDAVALDTVAGKIIGLSPTHVFTTWQAHRRGLGVGDLSLIDIKGESLEQVIVPDFKLSAVAVRLFRRYLPSFLYAYFQDKLAFIPQIRRSSCTGCGDCQQACPADAVKMVEDRAWIDERRCIHCLCCHEICAYHSVRLKQKAMGRVIRTLAGVWRRTRDLVS